MQHDSHLRSAQVSKSTHCRGKTDLVTRDLKWQKRLTLAHLRNAESSSLLIQAQARGRGTEVQTQTQTQIQTQPQTQPQTRALGRPCSTGGVATPDRSVQRLKLDRDHCLEWNAHTRHPKKKTQKSVPQYLYYATTEVLQRVLLRICAGCLSTLQHSSALARTPPARVWVPGSAGPHAHRRVTSECVQGNGTCRLFRIQGLGCWGQGLGFMYRRCRVTSELVAGLLQRHVCLGCRTELVWYNVFSNRTCSHIEM